MLNIEIHEGRDCETGPGFEVEGAQALAEDAYVDFVLFALGRDFEIVTPPPPPVRGWRIGPGRRPIWHERQSWAYRLAAAS